MMMLLIFFSVLCNFVLAAEEKPMYSTKYDNLDIDGILKSDRLLINYVGCLTDEKPCTPEASELKKNLPDALETDCASCSEAQKRMAEKMYHHLIDNKIEEWMKLEKKYDVNGNYRKHYLGIDVSTTIATPV